MKEHGKKMRANKRTKKRSGLVWSVWSGLSVYLVWSGLLWLSLCLSVYPIRYEGAIFCKSFCNLFLEKLQNYRTEGKPKQMKRKWKEMK